MTNIKIHNASTGEIIEREMTPEELIQFNKDQEEWQLIEDEKNQARLAKSSLLEKLGITEEEAKLLLS